MLKFLKKTSKKLVWTAFGVWKDRKIKKTKESIADALDKAVDRTSRCVQLGALGLIVVGGCAAGSFILLPFGAAMGRMATKLGGTEEDELVRILNTGSGVFLTIGAAMFAVLVLVLLFMAFSCRKKKKQLKSRIHQALRD